VVGYALPEKWIYESAVRVGAGRFRTQGEAASKGRSDEPERRQLRKHLHRLQIRIRCRVSQDPQHGDHLAFVMECMSDHMQ
jgi:hypothetical protein